MDFAQGIDDNELWDETEEAAQILGFSDEERVSMYKTCAGILHWGNGQFKQRPREEQADVADSKGTDVLFSMPFLLFYFQTCLMNICLNI